MTTDCPMCEVHRAEAEVLRARVKELEEQIKQLRRKIPKQQKPKTPMRIAR